MVIKLIQKHSKILVTAMLMVISIAFYGLPIKFIEKPRSTQFDIVQHEQVETPQEIDLFDFWGFSGNLTIFNAQELERISGILENFQYKSNMRKNKRLRMISYLLSNYNLTDREARTLVRSAEFNARKHKFDLELLMAVIFVESTYQPKAESSLGAIGLMQVVPKWHLDKISQYGDIDVLYDIRANIAIGAEILKEYVAKEGDLRTALHRYNGSKHDKTLKYSNRVFAKYDELKTRAYMEDARIKYHFNIISPQT